MLQKNNKVLPEKFRYGEISYLKYLTLFMKSFE